MSYHDLYIETKELKRTSIFNLPFAVLVTCTRVGGWQVWNRKELIAGEFDYKGLRLDVHGIVIVDSLTPKPPEYSTVTK
jgi:hypothetical protein